MDISSINVYSEEEYSSDISDISLNYKSKKDIDIMPMQKSNSKGTEVKIELEDRVEIAVSTYLQEIMKKDNLDVKPLGVIAK
jgi:hypothetical protein